MKKKENSSDKYTVPAVENAFKILNLLSRKSYRESTITEIANKLSLSPASCFRILQTLEKLTVVRYKKDNKKYTLGPYLIVLGDRAKSHLDYISIIQPYLEQLTSKTGLTSVLINRLEEDKLTIISKVEGDDYSVHVSVGRQFSLTDGGASGKCFTAYLDEEEREKYFNKETKNKRKKLILSEEEYEKVRKTGYSVTTEEVFKGIFGIAAPIFVDNAVPSMSIALIGLSAQVDDDQTIYFGKIISSMASEITKEISSI